MIIKAHWKKPKFEEPNIEDNEDLTQVALDLLAMPNVQNYNWIFERYDHEVRDGSLVKPITGRGRGKNEAIADHPVLGEKEVSVETWGSNPWQGDIDPYHMGRNNVVDAIGRVISIGGNLERITFNGNTTCPPPESDPLDAAKVERMIKGSKDAESVFYSPTISGKDSTSMKRSYVSTVTGKDVTVKAKPELLKSALAILPDDSTLITSDFKLPGDSIFIVGETKDELGASEYYKYHGAIGNRVPKSDLQTIKQRYENLVSSNNERLLHSSQYLSRLGLFYGLSNSALGGDLGIDVDISRLGEFRANAILFSESTGRFIVSVHPSKVNQFKEVMLGTYIEEIGTVREDKKFLIRYKGKTTIDTNVDSLREKIQGEIRF
ncbi:hypothetical protein HYW75_00405 [Candidatus Pacearchaeota archaeon]|nr:hypothetical protein [Candidatus Pacearchaeota archaeon]